MSGQLLPKSEVPRGPSEPVRDLIAGALPTILEEAGTEGLLALAIVGSCSRAEETWVDGKLISDVDVAAVLSRAVDPQAVARFESVGRALGNGISIGCFPMYSLRRYRTLEFYGAKRDGWVFWGDPAVFDHVRIDRPTDIPGWEAPRLAMNRVIDFMRADAGMLEPWYVAVKMYLALGEAALVLEGSYDPSYRSQNTLIGARSDLLGQRNLRDLFLAAVSVKLDAADHQNFQEGPEAHREQILSGLKALFSRYLGRDVEPLAGLSALSRQQRSIPHRAMYIARHASEPSVFGRAMRADPVFWFWRVALESLMGKPLQPDTDLAAILADFDRTHQPLPR